MVADSKQRWIDGDVLIFDDSFEHEVWNNSDEDRIIFIMEIFHADLSEKHKKTGSFME